MRKELRSDFTTRQTMLSDSFELYYYNDTSIKPVGLHSHDYYEFYLFLEGNADLEIGYKDDNGRTRMESLCQRLSSEMTYSEAHGSKVQVYDEQSSDVYSSKSNASDVHNPYNRSTSGLQSGDVVVIPPGISHHAVNPSGLSSQGNAATPPYRRFVFWISTKYLDRLSASSPDYRYLTDEALEGHYLHHLEPALFHDVQSHAIQVLEELHTSHFGHDEFLNLYVSQLLLTLSRYVYESEHKIDLSENSSIMNQLIHYIDEHLTEDISLDILADRLYVSKSYIVHSFKDRLGISIHQYIMKKRLAGCRDAMLSGTPISETYGNYGFNDYSNFYKAFRREYGLSPREYVDAHTV